MKSINIASLKSQLSYYLKLVQNGQTILIKDRNEPIAELIPYSQKSQSSRDRLIALGKIIPPSQKLNTKFSSLKEKVNGQELLDKTRDDK